MFILEATDVASGTDSLAVLQATPNGDGSFNVTSGCLFVFSGPAVGTYELIPNPNPPGPFISPSGAFIVDNQLFPGKDPLLDLYGLLFIGNGVEINIWGNGPSTPYSYFSSNGSLGSNNADVTQLSISDPSELISLDLFLISFLEDTGVLTLSAGSNLEARLLVAQRAINGGFKQVAINTLKGFVGAANSLAPGGIGACLGDVASAAISALGG
jgi:hypothetical protein